MAEASKTITNEIHKSSYEARVFPSGFVQGSSQPQERESKGSTPRALLIVGRTGRCQALGTTPTQRFTLRIRPWVGPLSLTEGFVSLPSEA